MAATPADGEAGLSTVLGAILLFGLFVSTMVAVQVNYVPVWDHQREAKLMDQIGGELAHLKADLERQVANRTSSTVSVPVRLAQEAGFSFLRGNAAPGSVVFEPAGPGEGVALSASRILVQAQDGTDLYALNEQWQPVMANGGQVTQVSSVEHLRLRIRLPENLTSAQSVTLTVRDAAGAYAGKLQVTNRDHGADYELRIQVFSAASPLVPITEHAQSWKKNLSNQPYWYLDTLQPAFGFDAVLAAARKPMTLAWSTTMGNAAESALVHVSSTDGRLGATGTLVEPFTHALQGGRLVLERQNQRYPEQTYILEHGALILVQPDGVAMVAPPALNVRAGPTQVAVDWTFPELAGAPSSVGGVQNAQVASTPVGARGSLTAFAPRLTFTLATEHPAVWQEYWNSTLARAGLSAASGHYRTTAAAGSVTVDLLGPLADPADLTTDIAIGLRQARLGLQLLPSA